jgi:adenosylcobyric acid synthase
VLVEGAGSPAEVNLRTNDIANMGFARKADVPVALVGDIDRGGVIAQLVGIKAVLDPEDAAMIGGFIVNKFRGDPTLFDDGYRLIEARTGWQGFGVLPYFARADELPAEDALGLGESRKSGKCKIAFLALSRIANFDDLDPLRLEPEVDLVMVRPGTAIPGDCRLPFCAHKAGISTFSPIIVAAATCSAFAAATRCSDKTWRTRRESKALPERRRALDFWMFQR